MKLFNEFGIDIGYVVLGMAGGYIIYFSYANCDNGKTAVQEKNIKILWLEKMEKSRKKAIILISFRQSMC